VANKVETVPGTVTALKYEQFTSLSAAVSLNPPDNAVFAIITCETANVRYRDDGTDPTTDVGQLLTTSWVLQYTANLKSVRFIEVATGAKLNVSYYGSAS
jgi:hypothetical protein